MSPHHAEVVFQADGETLHGTKIAPTSSDPVLSVLSLHGAGTAVRQRVFYLADAMAPLGIATFAFDFSGHGESTGTLRESSLKRRVVQAQAALEAAAFTTPTILMGNSMGGYIAASLATIVNPAALILLCPALYDDEAYDVPFDERFTAILRANDSYERSTLPDRLRAYTGHVLLLIGEHDDVIPQRVIEIYESSFASAKSFSSLRIAGAPHVLHVWAGTTGNTSKLLGPIQTFLDSRFT